ncbi:MAG TPA: LPS-assembly protein LptD, partial [Hyphomicrobiales bacterium]|nr:LPS-assembly protein LptD [Hyphomicrobiales bacterium]
MLNRLLVSVLAAFGCLAGVAHAQQASIQTRGGETTIAKQVAPDKTKPLLLQADALVYDNRNNRVIARGNVEIYQDENILLADEVVYDKVSNTLTAIGNVRLRDSDGSVTNAERLTLQSNFRDGFIRSLRSLGQDDSRIAAQNAYRKDGNTTVFENGVATACKPCEEHPDWPPTWRIKAARIIHDKAEQNIYYEDATFEIYGVPVAWVPYFYQPDPTVKQRSGFLAPYYAHDSNIGYAVAIPYYYAISPNYDLTLTPEFTTQAGYLMQAQWRQRLWNGAYEINLAGAYNDNAKDFLGDRNWRGSVQTKGDFALNAYWHFGWNAIAESDDTFRRFYRIDDIYATERVSTVYLTGLGDRNYFNLSLNRYGNLTGETYNFDTNSYQKAVTATAYPSLDYNYVHNKPVLGGEFSFDLNALALTVNDPANLISPVFRRDTDHIVTQAQWRRTLTDDIGQVFTPFAFARGDVYHVSSFQDVDGTAGQTDTFTRQMVGAGLEYRYPFVSHTETATQVIEPIAQIISRGGASENHKIPNEDAQSLVFDDTLLFDINKFSGYDRIETGTRTNIGAQYTFQTYNGASFRIIGGESIQLAGSNPYDPTTGLGTDRSDYVVGGYLDWKNQFRFVTQLRFNEKDLNLARQDYSLQAKLGWFSGSVSYVAVEAQPQLGFPTAREEVATF